MITIPPSKSYTQRALMTAALAPGQSILQKILRCDDSYMLIAALEQFGVTFEDKKSDLIVNSPEKLRAPSKPLHIHHCGTAARFLIALSLLVENPFTIDGSKRMRNRPFGGLFAALKQLGVTCVFLAEENCLPVTLIPPRRLSPLGDKGRLVGVNSFVELDASRSSQQLSGLLLVAPMLPDGLEVNLTSELPSRPYVDMTCDVMSYFGADVRIDGNSFHVLPSPYRATTFEIECDWSSASYPLAANFLTRKHMELSDLNDHSQQGDRAVRKFLEELRSEGDLTFNLRNTPDIVPTLVVCSLFRKGSVTLTGLGHLRLKESDRLHVLAKELKKIGARISESDDGLTIDPSVLQGGIVLDPHDDHRMAMAFGLLQLRLDDISISNRACVSKSYPDYWKMLEVYR
jgi:3-phosphoshikimate 1-carboxyvinyltransferase